MKNWIRPLVLVPPDCCDAKAIRRMELAGYLVVQARDVSAVRIITPPPLVPLDKMAAVAIEVLADQTIVDSWVRDAFYKRVTKLAAAQMKPS